MENSGNLINIIGKYDLAAKKYIFLTVHLRSKIFSAGKN